MNPMVSTTTRREVELPFDVPSERLGQNHIVRDEIPEINPGISDFMERQEAREREMLARFQERASEIAVADTVELRLEAFAS